MPVLVNSFVLGGCSGRQVDRGRRVGGQNGCRPRENKARHRFRCKSVFVIELRANNIKLEVGHPLLLPNNHHHPKTSVLAHTDGGGARVTTRVNTP